MMFRGYGHANRTRRGIAIAAGLVSALALTACSFEHDHALDTTPGDDLTAEREARGISHWGFASSSDQGAGGVATEGKGENGEPVTLPKRTLTMAFAGDIMFEQHLLPLALDAGALSELQSSLGAADLAVANMETALTDRGAPWPGKPFTFRAPTSAIDTVAGAGVDAITMANNHAFDYGDQGAADTLNAKDNSPIPIVGIGRDEDEAYQPATLEANGVKVAIIGASQVEEETRLYRSATENEYGIAAAAPDKWLARLIEEVKAAKKDHDVVVTMMHWGVEAEHCPGDEAIATSRALEQAGADAIIASHAHRLNGHGWVGDSYVHYGLGNFVYYLNRDTAGHTGVLTLNIEVPETSIGGDEPRVGDAKVTQADWQPMLIGGDGIPRPASDVAGQGAEDELNTLIESYRECTPARERP